MRSFRVSRLRRIVALLLTVVTVAAGSAHAGHPEPPGPDLSAYALPDGTLPVLCLSGEAEPELWRCELCLQFVSVASPPRPWEPGPRLQRAARLRVSARPLRPHGRPFERAPRPRDPPARRSA
ncbi:MAG: hypothetical protein ACE37J_20685 [Pikeienuella sp.]|uniref:hypothetical protein n=1 Tax=Pikeienuella sp. TaxID=2831957 RepID=UPI00391A16FE